VESPVDGPFEDHFTSSTSITIGNGLLGFVATFLLHPPRFLVRCQIGVLFHPAGEGDPSGLSHFWGLRHVQKPVQTIPIQQQVILAG